VNRLGVALHYVTWTRHKNQTANKLNLNTSP
jgi:hypothetical protein